MEQEQFISNAFSSVPETQNSDFDPRLQLQACANPQLQLQACANPQLQLQACASNAPGFNPNSNFSSQIIYQIPQAAFRNSESDFIPEQPAECNSETNFPPDPSQASACSFEGEYEEEGECTCESDSDSSSPNEQSENRAILEEIVNELYEELIIEHCFQVHQAYKLGAYIDEENEVESQIPKETSVSKSIKCPSCNKEHELQNYKLKLGECMGLQTRKSRRTPKTKVTSFAEQSNDSSSNGRKPTTKKRKQPSKKGNPKNARVKIQPRDSGNPDMDYYPSTSWQQDYYAGNPKKYCGQITKSGSRCMKAPNCSAHKTEYKTNYYDASSSFSKSSQCYKEELYSTNIDFDTVDTNSRDQVQRTHISDSFNFSSPPDFNPNVTRSEKNGKIKVIIKTDGQKKKKKPKLIESTYSSHSFDPTYPGPK